MKKLLLKVFALAFVSGLSACQSCGSFRAAWYLMEDLPSSQSADASQERHWKMSIALLNQGFQPVTVNTINLNSSGDQAVDGWKRTRNQTVDVGRLLVMDASEFEPIGRAQQFGSCHVPVRVDIQCTNPDARSRVEVSGTLPNYLPSGWPDSTQKECAP